MNELDFFDTDLDDFELDDDFGGAREKTRIHKPKVTKARNPKTILYHNAVKIAKQIDFIDQDRYFIVVDGSFIFGDFIEAFVVSNNIKCKNLTISTLSMNVGNVDSLANLLNGGYLDELNLIVSDYFYSHERNDLIPYIYQELDKDDKFQLAVAGTHCKLCLIETLGGKKITMHGSANLRSSDSLEQFCIEDNAELYDFNLSIQNRILDKYQTINKAIRGKTLYNLIKDGKEESEIK